MFWDILIDLTGSSLLSQQDGPAPQKAVERKHQLSRRLSSCEETEHPIAHNPWACLLMKNQTPNEKRWLAVFLRGVWNCVDTGNVTIFKVVKNFSCWTVVVSVVLTVCKIAHKHSLSY